MTRPNEKSRTSAEDEVTTSHEKAMLLRSTMEDALLRRDYKRALRAKEEFATAVDMEQKCVFRAGRRDVSAELGRVDAERHEEEAALCRQVIEQAKSSVVQFEHRLSAMEARHSSEIEAIEKKVNDPSYGLPRLSPYLGTLIRTEEAYAKAGDLQKAGAAYEDVLLVTSSVYGSADRDADHMVEAMVARLMQRHEKEKRRFLDAISASKNVFDRAVRDGLALLERKYARLRLHAVGKEKCAVPVAKAPADAIYHQLDAVFAPILDRAGVLGYTLAGPASGPERVNRRVQRAVERGIAARTRGRARSVAGSYSGAR